MENEPINLEFLVKGYTANIRQLSKELDSLSRDAEELTEAIAVDKVQRETAQANLDALRRSQASLQSERQSLMGEHAEATFTQDAGELQRIARRRVELDKELKQVDREIIRSSSVSQPTDYAQQAAELQTTKEKLESRLPRQYFHTNTNLHPVLEGIEQVLREDSERLRKRWSAINIPHVYSKETIESIRLENGQKTYSDPAYLLRKEQERKERMAYFDTVAGNTDAYAAAIPERDRKPQQSALRVEDADDTADRSQVLSGDEILKALAKKSA